MAANNIHVLKREEVKYLRERFIVEYDKENEALLINVRNFNRISRYNINDKIFLRWYDISTGKPRKLTITNQAIKMWLEHFPKTHHIVEVQNAVNTLLVTYQDVTYENVKQKLSNPEGIKIRKV